MKRHKRLLPYIRRMKGGDKSASFRVVFQMMAPGRLYVLVQRGTPGVLACGETKLALVRQLAGARTQALRRPGGNWKKPTMKDFRAWARSVVKSEE